MSSFHRRTHFQSDSHYCKCGYVFEECKCYETPSVTIPTNYQTLNTHCIAQPEAASADGTLWFVLNPHLSELRDAKGNKLAEVMQCGGSWVCRYGFEQIAFRPDKLSAQECIERYHEALKLNGGKL